MPKASMEPLFFKAENVNPVRPIRLEWEASMEPLFFKAENARGCGDCLSGSAGFNGAAFFQSGKFNLASHTFAGTVTAVSGLQVTAPAWAGKPADYFVNGHLITADGRSDTIDEYLPGPGTVRTRSNLGIAIGDTVTAVAGCDGAFATCQGRFGSETNNGLAWGGFRIPSRDPQRGGII